MTTSTRDRPAVHPVVVAGWVALAVVAGLVAGLLAGALGGPDVPVRVGAAVTRSTMDAAAVACVGLTLLGVLLPLGAAALPGSALRDLVRVQDTADRALVPVAGAWLVIVLVGIALRSADALGRPLGRLTATDIGAWATQLTAGRGMLLTAACAAAVLGCGIARLRRRDAVPVRVSAVLALLGALLPTLTGHSGSAPDHQLTVMSAALHVAAAALWVGGLGVLLVLVARHRDLLDGVLPRYSTLAGGCLLAVAVTGVLNAATRLDGWGALVTSGYGWLVVTKTVLLVALAGLGWLARRRLLAHRTPVLRWAGVEVAVMALTIGVAAALSQTGTTNPDGLAPGHGEHRPAGGGHASHDEAATPTGTIDLWAVQSVRLGTVVVDPGFRILYRFERDSAQPSNSTCIDQTCTAAWEPLLADGRQVVGHGVGQDAIGTVVRPDGTRQVTLAGWPLYLRVGETDGLATGGANGTDGLWFAVAPTGDRATPPPGG